MTLRPIRPVPALLLALVLSTSIACATQNTPPPIAAAAPAPPRAEARDVHALLGTLPATFTGIVPCADCAGIRYQIDLLPGGGYMQSASYLRAGHDETFYQLGGWTRTGRTLTLDDGGPDGPAQWELVDRRTLRRRDGIDPAIDSRLPFELRRREGASPVVPRVTLTGMFSRSAGGPRLRDCASDLAMRVETEGDYPALERAYVASRPGPRTELQVTLEGRIEPRPSSAGVGAGYTLIVERFLRASPGANCTPRNAPPSEDGGLAGLENNRWRPVRIAGRPVMVTGDSREPWIVLEPRDHRVTGSGGCNRFSGSYRAGETTLRLGPLVSTRMACPTMETESAFFRALEATRRYRVSGRTLELLDDRGRVLVVLEESNLD